VGSDDEVIFPVEAEKGQEGQFIVHFHGGFNPMQGVKYIIQAAYLLKKENIKFRIIGKGQTYDRDYSRAKKLKLKNIEFVSKIVPYKKLRMYMGESDICLGIFSTNSKAKIVIPNKAYEALAMKKPLITRSSSAVKELLTDGVNCLYCQPGDARDLADKILTLYHNKKLRDDIAQKGYDLFKEKLTPEILGRELAQYISEI